MTSVDRTPRFRAQRGPGPLIVPATSSSIGTNIQGPSVIRTPAWLPDALGAYYLYFADHKGGFIRLAWADDLDGPWTVHEPGSLHLADSYFLTERPALSDEHMARIAGRYADIMGPGYGLEELADDLTAPHIASPDVHVDEANRRIVMYFHGLEDLGDQQTRVAVSNDGHSFVVQPPLLGPSYFRVFDLRGTRYALAMPGVIHRSANGFNEFVPGPTLFESTMRHSAVLVSEGTGSDGDQVHVFWSRVGDAPESILHSVIAADGPMEEWTVGEPVRLLAPERPWEGADLPNAASRRGAAERAVNQLRDPAVLIDDGQIWLFYAVQGERGIASAELIGQ